MKKLVSLLLVFLMSLQGLALEEKEWIAIAPNAVLPETADLERVYPRTLRRGAASYDEEALVEALLGADYETQTRTEWAYANEYTAKKNGLQPWEYCHVTVYDADKTFDFYDPRVAGERGGEYEPPCMNMTVQESTLLARALMEPFLAEGFTAHPNSQRQIRERWSPAGRWMTEQEYESFMKEQKTHSILFDNVSSTGVSILDETLMVTVGVNGLSGFMLKWHEFEESSEMACLMPLDEALDMANSTRSAKTTLLAAQIVYSNWVTQRENRPEEYNLGWLLITSQGNYFVDCVENAHVCDSYEY